MVGFTTQQAARFSQLTLRQVNYFDTTKLLSPSMQIAKGKGSRRLYSFRDVVALRLIAKLRSQGLSLQSVRKAIAYLRNLGQDDLSRVVFAINGDDVVLVEPDRLAVSLVEQPGQLCFLIGIGGITQEVEAAIRQVG